jgi:uncharacterized protein DUF6916
MNDPETFREQLDTIFQLDDPSGPIQLRLVEVADEGVARGIRQFSVFFHGPADRVLPQNTYSFTHEALGSLAFFIVPVVGSNQERIVYQACFSVVAPRTGAL